jgi:starch phosphorylase
MENRFLEQTNGHRAKIAYFSMEVGITQEIPTYSGGLGILAGDTLKSCADLQLPVIGITLFHEKGYFFQTLDEKGNQNEKPVKWDPTSHQLELLPFKVSVTIDQREVTIQAWRYTLNGLSGSQVPIYFLDTGLPENEPPDQGITAHLYGGDTEYRLKQEIILGIGGIRMLREIGYKDLHTFHMNEGHASLLTLELLREGRKRAEEVWIEEAQWDIHQVKDLCVFTTHTPVPAGHDRFSYDLVKKLLGRKSEDRLSDSEEYWWINDLPIKMVQKLAGEEDFHMTLLALNLSRYANGVAKKHGETSKRLFPTHKIDSITNGVHTFTWTSAPFKKLFDNFIPGWTNDPFLLRHTISIPPHAIWEAHQECKKRLCDIVKQKTEVQLDPNRFTIGFARRATAYKRADLLFHDIERLREISKKGGGIQLVFAGKAHPKDEPGKDLIRTIFHHIESLKEDISAVYLKNYDIYLGGLLTSGVDVWLNTPLRPHEASGTSGMKSALNGVLNFSILDGWWIEGHREGITGWSIGTPPTEETLQEDTREGDAADLYYKLEEIILPKYYSDQNGWIEMMKNALSLNSSFFSTHRMMLQYVTSAYLKKIT